MIAALAAAGLLTLAQHGSSNTPIGELADELEATGTIHCPISPEEKALNDQSNARLDHISDLFGGYYPDRRIFGCSVIRLQVYPSGRVKTIKVVRYRGESTLEDKASHIVFKPSDGEWTALLSISAGVPPEERAAAARELRELAVKVAPAMSSPD